MKLSPADIMSGVTAGVTAVVQLILSYVAISLNTCWHSELANGRWRSISR